MLHQWTPTVPLPEQTVFSRLSAILFLSEFLAQVWPSMPRRRLHSASGKHNATQVHSRPPWQPTCILNPKHESHPGAGISQGKARLVFPLLFPASTRLPTSDQPDDFVRDDAKAQMASPMGKQCGGLLDSRPPLDPSRMGYWPSRHGRLLVAFLFNLANDLPLPLRRD